MSAELFDQDVRIIPGRRLSGRVEMLLKTPNADFPTQQTQSLELTFDGIAGDRHGGKTRLSGGREPWYPRGTEIVNERQLSLLCEDELRATAKAMEIEELRPEWIGANIVLSGLPRFSMIPPRTRLAFSSGAVLNVDGQNAPCRIAGKSIAENYPLKTGLDLLFPKVAQRSRGLVAFVERPGAIRTGDSVTAHIQEQWIYEA